MAQITIGPDAVFSIGGLTNGKLASDAAAVISECIDAMQAHRAMASHHEAYAVIREEFEQEYWPLVCENPLKKNGVKILYQHDKDANIARRNTELRSELIQTAAMAIRALHDLC